MPTPIEIAVRSYEAAWNEPDPAVRARLIDAFFADDGRIVTRSTEIRGRAALAAAMTSFRADPRDMTARITSAIDVHGSMFRFRAITLHRDGTTSPDVFDAGLVDADNRIALILTFAGPLPDA